MMNEQNLLWNLIFQNTKEEAKLIKWRDVDPNIALKWFNIIFIDTLPIQATLRVVRIPFLWLVGSSHI